MENDFTNIMVLLSLLFLLLLLLLLLLLEYSKDNMVASSKTRKPTEVIVSARGPRGVVIFRTEFSVSDRLWFFGSILVDFRFPQGT